MSKEDNCAYEISRELDAAVVNSCTELPCHAPQSDLQTPICNARANYKQQTIPDSRLRTTSVGKRKRRLPTLRIAHLDDLDIIRHIDITHSLRRNEDKLAADGCTCCFNLD